MIMMAVILLLKAVLIITMTSAITLDPSPALSKNLTNSSKFEVAANNINKQPELPTTTDTLFKNAAKCVIFLLFICWCLKFTNSSRRPDSNQIQEPKYSDSPPPYDPPPSYDECIVAQQQHD
ncbi:unnamed protein product [Orchesella dallaii]|uniref:Uncharacterized protein n=1 Tax=Orchesella dallaii TaxID=48710 RepID=A0ABP1RV22_9HEXA